MKVDHSCWAIGEIEGDNFILVRRFEGRGYRGSYWAVHERRFGLGRKDLIMRISY